MGSPRIVDRLVALGGGVENLRGILDADMRAFDKAWDQDADLIGRILRAHLAVEHFMTDCIVGTNPHLGSLDAARLSFAQKVELLDGNDAIVVAIRPGLRKLNEVRNRLAHRLNHPLNRIDVEPMLDIGQFRAVREAVYGPPAPSDPPIVILEGFARFAAGILQSQVSQWGKLLREAATSA